MQSTLLLTVPNTPFRHGIVQDFAAGAAIRSGLAPLAADRAGRGVAELADAAGDEPVTLEARIGDGELRIALSAGAGDPHVLEYRRPPLRPV